MNYIHNRERERLPLSKEAAEIYDIPSSVFEEDETGRIVVVDSIRRAREIAFALNEKGKEVSAAEIYVTALLDKSYEMIFSRYCNEAVSGNSSENPFLFVQEKLNGDSRYRFSDVFSGFKDRFICLEKAGKEKDLTELCPSGDFIKEMISLDLLNANPALSKNKELFDDSRIEPQGFYRRDQKEIKKIFKTLPLVGKGNKESLIEFLFRPIEKFPHSLIDQLKFAAEYWKDYLGDFLLLLISAVDLITEETKPRFLGPGEPQGIDFSFEDRANYSRDSDWMPRVVLLAKNALVWLDQLSKKYDKKIVTLADIPNEELDILAGRGFSSLWLIGIWNRSKASRRIKVICGNPEAEASAYSLYDYEISGAVGGYEAFADLDIRCKARGIRLASDMVPNHTGMDSKWVREHPDYFLQLDYSPMPHYSYNGEDLCEDPNVQVFLEDHYYEKSDCAVVFKRRDVNSGEERYIYHGNDGTAMPWNDTAQINFLNPEAREAVIREILNVARKFSIIRFDAAMTLAKRHIQRLWFPEPGSGGDIPTRSEHSMSRADFEQAIPVEFWEEVVNRIAQEVPNTLLLAEAFWMMEGYFVRNLGMHRVYNSAFMNMLKMERNKDYRDTVKNTLSYDEQILKRYVNFMNNPDEDTAVAQFGKGDKYFGVCILLATMPGLPMFGHGQIEGFEEKYGMEYRKAYWDETPDEGLINYHEKIIFPLLRKRAIFSEVENFAFYDFYTPDHKLDENVFAYSNDYLGEKSLVLYNNSFDGTSGWIKDSVLSRVCISDDESYERTTSVWNAFGLGQGEGRFCIFKENISGLWYIRYSDEIFHGGIYFSLKGYEANVFLSIREVEDITKRGIFTQLYDRLKGSGTPDILRSLRDIELEPVYKPLEKILKGETFRTVLSSLSQTEPGGFVNDQKKTPGELFTDEILCEINLFREADDMSMGMESGSSVSEIIKGVSDQRGSDLLSQKIGAGKRSDGSFEKRLKIAAEKAGKKWETLLENISRIQKRFSAYSKQKNQIIGTEVFLLCGEIYPVLYLRLFIADFLTDIYGEKIVERWDLTFKLNEIFPLEENITDNKSREEALLLSDRILSSFDCYCRINKKNFNEPGELFLKLYREGLKDRIGVNLFDEKLWFNKELFEKEMINILLIASYLFDTAKGGETAVKKAVSVIGDWTESARRSDYLVDNLLKNLLSKIAE